MGLFSRKKSAESDSAHVTTESRVDDRVEKEHGPYDITEVSGDDDRIDFGVLRVPKFPGAKIQFTINRRTRDAMGALIQFDGGQMQLNVYAAPKSRSLWADIREELVTSVKADGGTASYREGFFGPEVEARVPRKDVKETRHVRYVGVDGPRWFLRATLEGQAVVNPAVREKFYEFMKDVVVVRGQEPHPVRDLIMLTIPESAQAKVDEKLGVPSLPKRGPEISEIR